MPLTEAQNELHGLMSDVSELVYFARWMAQTEFRLWSFVSDPNDTGEWGGRTIPEEFRAELRRRSEEIGGWIRWQDGEDLPKEEWGPIFVPTSDWLKTYQAHVRQLQESVQRVTSIS